MRRRQGLDDDQEPLLEMSKAEVDPYYSVREYVFIEFFLITIGNLLIVKYFYYS